MPRVLIPLAPGFEEIEAVSIIDVLRRGDVDVVVAGTTGEASVEGSHALRVGVDVALDDVRDQSFDMIVLPGGEPGVTHLCANHQLETLLARHLAAGRTVGAICAAPRLLAARGDLDGRRATSHPSVADAVRAGGALYDDDDRVVHDGVFLTSRGPGTALEFALRVLELLGHAPQAERLRGAMLVAPS